MTATVTASLLLSLVAIGSRPTDVVPARPPGLDSIERDALRLLEDEQLLTLRAGAPVTPAPADEAERAELRRLEDRALETRRAGDLTLSNEDLTTILLVLGIVALLVIIF